MAKISVFGLGYVGAVTAACLADQGHSVIGVDPNVQKVNFINDGKSPIMEAGMEELVSASVAAGRLSATQVAQEAVLNSDISFVCVGTPSLRSGALDLSFIERVCRRIGESLKTLDRFHIVNIRSTILPGTMRQTVLPILEDASGKTAGTDFGLCHNPEFLREGTAVKDFYAPPKTVVGALDPVTSAKVCDLYNATNAPQISTDIDTAEMVKYTDNAWHALKIGFANEIGVLCKSLDIDSHRVMDIFCEDKKLNISASYLKPGFAFGGSCLPKDLRALCYKARANNAHLPILEHILPSNQKQIERAIEMILAQGHRKIGVLGVSFKAGTDDLRESPMVDVIERLIGRGFDLKVYDEGVRLASLTGANRAFIMDRIPHISELLCQDIDTVLDHAQTLVIGTTDAAVRSIAARLKDQHVIDLIRISEVEDRHGAYDGICW